MGILLKGEFQKLYLFCLNYILRNQKMHSQLIKQDQTYKPRKASAMHKSNTLVNLDHIFGTNNTESDFLSNYISLENSLKMETLISESTLTETPKKNQEKRNRRQSFIELEQMNKSKIQKMIRNDRKLSYDVPELREEEEELVVCSSIIYAKSDGNWKNRQVIDLTTSKLHQNKIQLITKLKIRNEEPLTGYKMFKYCSVEEVHQLAIRKIDIPIWFSNTIWTYLVANGNELAIWTATDDEEVSGQIYKKSQILGRWQPRMARISASDGFTSCKVEEEKQNSPSLIIKQTQQVWTRFELTRFGHQSFVIFKLWYGLFKIEIAVPLLESPKWAGCLAKLVM